ncbi:hypothetical protein, partial [Phenylobacterium sp.]|uniref:hypothetical protein n=1 Tax=Phenylobacterium sp. TaxID=1871053 RepID=UPI00398360E9
PGQMVDEFAHLQLRMICELVALACLVAHHDIEATRNAKLQSAFAADWLLKSLEELNPGCFPGPVVKANTLPGGPHHFVERGPDFMTRDELLKLYSRECGLVLHRGSLKNLLKANSTV